MIHLLQPVFNAFGLTGITEVLPFGPGLINTTWKVSGKAYTYILQRINQRVFKIPANIAFNIALVDRYLQQHYPDYLFVTPIRTLKQEDIFFDGADGYYRLTPFVANSHTIDAVVTPGQAFEAAAQFGKFTALLAGFDAAQLKVTIAHFHDLGLRYRQFELALLNGNTARIAQCKALTDEIIANRPLVEIFEKITTSPHFKIRVTHHDTKISNILFDANDKAICLIDLDTLMPGYFISDAGDMLRTYLSPVSEEEQDLAKIEIRESIFIAIAKGYIGQLAQELSKEEKNHFVYAGKCMIYMQAIRFITDHLNNDIYYGAKYEGHNFVRAANQLTLLQKLQEKEQYLQELVNRF
jgi:hypothetical protein